MGFALQPFSRHSCLVCHWQQHMEKEFETHVKGRKHKNWERNFNPANNDVNQQETQATCEARTGIILGPSQFISPYLFLSMKSPFLPFMPLGHEYYKEEPLTSSLKHSRIYMHFLAYIV